VIHRTGPRRGAGVLAAALVVALGLTACSGGGNKHKGGGVNHFPASSTSPSTSTPISTSGASPLGAHWDFSREQQFEPYLQTIPGTSTFDEILWCTIEPTPGAYNWSSVDKVAKATKKLGITLMLKIRTGVCANTQSKDAAHVRGQANKTESSMPASMSAYSAFVTAVVKHYAPMGVSEFAIENEVNSASYWSGTPQQYVQLVTTAAKAIRAADPSAKVVDDGMSSTSYGYGIAQRLLQAGQGQQAVQAYDTYFSRRIGTRGQQIPNVTSTSQLQSVLNSAQGQRNLAYLAVAQQLSQQKIVDVRQVHFYEDWTAVPDLLTYLHATTPSSTPIEAWEVGSFWQNSNASAAVRTADMVKSVSLLLAGGVTKAIWLPLAANADNRRGQEVRYGLLNPDGSSRPAGVTMTAMSSAARNATATAVDSKGLQGVAFTVNGTSTLVVWSTGASVSMKPTGATPKTAQLGQLPSAASGSVTIGTTPVIVQAAQSVSALVASAAG
jgi:hypothetical protein